MDAIYREVLKEWPKDFPCNVSDLKHVANRLAAKRKEAGASSRCTQCLDPGASGVKCFIRSRLLEIHPFVPPVQCVEETRLTVELHFWPWDEERYGKWEDEPKTHNRETTREARSPLHRIAKSPATPINRQTYRVAGKGHPSSK